MQDFFEDIDRFNQIYRLPRPEAPQDLGAERLKNFKDILAEELEEVDEIISAYQGDSTADEQASLARLTEVADWLGDIVVYCSSEARRWGLPMDRILRVIMESNFSKLDAEGNPIYDDRGKVMKGPNYWKPEPKIEAELQKH